MDTKNIRHTIQQENRKSKTQFVILDDDPTGCQTVHNLDIYFAWDEITILNALNTGRDFFLLINTRAYSRDKAVEINAGIGNNISAYSKKTNKKINIISRSDSTLRGHFLPETDTLSKTCGPFDGLIVCPYFKEGNRITRNDTHYINSPDGLIPVNETEFANDPAFGFKHAHLPAWIEEKSEGKWKKENVLTVTRDDINNGIDAVYRKLLQVSNYTPVVLNAEEDADLDVIAQGFQKAERDGKKFLYRTAASFVKVRLGIKDIALYEPEKKKFGLVIAGSYVQKTTSQIEYLKNHAKIKPIEINIDAVLHDYETYLSDITTEVNTIFKTSESVLISTQRDVYQASSEDFLKTGERVIDFLTALVGNLSTMPEFIIAKGGITSNEIARRGLKADKAKVMGQIAPGVPIIQLGKESLFPGVDYIIFPGNVGDETTLHEIFNKFLQSKKV